MSDQVLLSSFNPFVLRSAKRAGPEIECALLTAPDLPGWMRSGVARRWSLAQALHPEFVMVDEQYMAGARKRGMPVRPWTVNEEADMRRLRDLGVDAIITDWPDRLKALLG
jgi:glycerophosphoryl diester phosphodiesterase